jgi:hypothetical protein
MTETTQDGADVVERPTMDKAKHTPGPWRIFTNTDGSKLIGIGELTGDGIADCGFGLWRGGEAEAIANARLIAAAPEMFEALQDILEYSASVEKYAVLAKRYGVGETTISNIKARRRWTHVD